MTIKEIATFTDKTAVTIQNWIKKISILNKETLLTNKETLLRNKKGLNLALLPSILEKHANSSPMKPADYTIEEVEQILKAGTMSKDAIHIVMNNAYENQNKKLPSQPIQLTNYMQNLDLFVERLVPKIIETTIKTLAGQFHFEVKKETEKGQKQIAEIEILPESPKVRERNPARNKINNLVNKATKVFNLTYRQVWSNIYIQLKEELGIDISLILYNRRLNNKNVKALDIIEELHLIDKCAIIIHEWEKPPVEPIIDPEDVFKKDMD